ncbi:uncharacterized protein DUF3379 [Alteromonadaceae bacterium 2753L.S.0a.02]|nr:uncharacterized protein DUF3379 [Alteromonadaceae bacterium 2753L.S.0a.02]
MNCLEFRQRLITNPGDQDATLTEHREHCVKCAKFSKELQQHEAKLRQALNVTVPPRLAERILLANDLRKPRWKPYAAAAAITLAITLGGTAVWRSEPRISATWSEIALAHVLNERDTLQSNAQVSNGELGAALAQFGLTLKAGLGRVLFLEKCDMPGGKGLHIVFDSPQAGRVTLIIPPKGSTVDTGSSTRDGFASAMTKIGSIAVGIVTDRPDQMYFLTHGLLKNRLATS